MNWFNFGLANMSYYRTEKWANSVAPGEESHSVSARLQASRWEALLDLLLMLLQSRPCCLVRHKKLSLRPDEPYLYAGSARRLTLTSSTACFRSWLARHPERHSS